jgi:hypothetical protein
MDEETKAMIILKYGQVSDWPSSSQIFDIMKHEDGYFILYNWLVEFFISYQKEEYNFERIEESLRYYESRTNIAMETAELVEDMQWNDRCVQNKEYLIDNLFYWMKLAYEMSNE